MKALRSHQMLSGFFLESPVAALPAITHCGEALCSARHTLTPHAHAGFEFVYLSRGHAFWRMRDTLVHQRMGDLLITYPREVHDTNREPGVEFYLNWIGLDLDQLGRDGRKLATLLRAERPHLLTQCHEMEAVLRGIYAQMVAERPLRDRVILQYLRTFLRLLEQRLRVPASAAPTVGPYSPATTRALEFLKRTLDRRATVSELAAAAAVGSVARFGARFRRELGVTPGAYHLRLRLDAARQALRQPESRVTHVAMRYGFSSSQHFSTAFRRLFGVTPRKWQTGTGRPVRR